MPLTKKNSFTLILIILHAVGLVGFIINPQFFKPLSFINLIISILLILLANEVIEGRLLKNLLIISIIGYLVEVIGVKTGFIFGEYTYGNSLGLKLLNVPLLIGANWAILLYSTAQLCFTKNMYLNAMIGAVLMVFLDYFMEQNAARFDFWYWKQAVIPIQNFIAWFLISFILNLFFQKELMKSKNSVAKNFYYIQCLFFVILYLVNFKQII